MTAEQLDTLYAALSEALARAGEARAPLLLATLSLDLLAHHADHETAMESIARAERVSAR